MFKDLFAGKSILRKIYSKFPFLSRTYKVKCSTFIRCVTYRQKLGGIISYLHGKYFSDEPAPFSGMPGTIITQSQQQSQSVLIQMVLDIERKVNEKIGNYEDGSKEKNFMQKLKSSLSSIANVTDLITKLSKIANECSLNLEEISNIFS